MTIYDEYEKSVMVVGGEDITTKAANCSDAYKASERFVKQITNNCDETQRRVLKEILTQNAETEYLKRYGTFQGCVDREMFKRKIPVVTYEDIKSDIMRIYDGDKSPILCTQPISELWLSSGTSEGRGKLLPATDDEMKRRHALLTSVTPFIKGQVEGPTKPSKGKALGLLVTREEITTPGGLLVRPGLNSVFKNPQFYCDKPFPDNFNTSPIEAIHCPDHFQSIYTQLLCGFYQRVDVTYIKAVFGSNLVWATNFLKRHYRELCSDISSGSLSPKILDPNLRAYMLKTFMQHREVELAKVIEDLCVGENWEGIFRKIWPNVKYLETVVTGSMAQYIPLLNYYSGGLPLVSVKYSSSECDLGFNLNPNSDPYNVSYTLMPSIAYYEFIPLKSSEDGSTDLQTRTVDLAHVEVGKEYEVVVTTYCGLYRYRVGDVLSPTSFYNSTPQFKFVRKKNVLLSIDFAKTTETELQNAINSASGLLHPFGSKVAEYTSYADVSNIPGHYVIYMELLMTTTKENYPSQEVLEQCCNYPSQEVLEQCCFAMEGFFDVQYTNGRVDESIGPLEIRVVGKGAFDKLREYAISQGASFLQYKVPRCMKSLPMLELLNSGVVLTHFSRCVPKTVHKIVSNEPQV